MRVSDSSLKGSGYEHPCKLNKQGVPHVLSVSYAALLQLQSGGEGGGPGSRFAENEKAFQNSRNMK